MKRLLLIVLLASVQISLKAQKLEFSVQANTGTAFYAGKSAVAESSINQGASADMNYTNNPYGTYTAISYGGGFKANWITANGIIFGTQADYEILRSKVNITSVNNLYIDPLAYSLVAYAQPSVKGSTYLNSNFINLSPFIGYRLHDESISVDLMPGLDIGLGLSNREKGTANIQSGTYNNQINTNRQRQKPPTDIRLRFGMSIKYRKISFNGSYATGRSNYMEGMLGAASPEVYSRVLRFGLGYQLN